MRYAVIYKEKEIVAEVEIQDGAGLFYNDREYICKIFDDEKDAEQMKEFIGLDKLKKEDYEKLLKAGKQEYSEKETEVQLKRKAENYLSTTEYLQIKKKEDGKIEIGKQ